jgi:putative ABC transport system ATP-binding protein
MSKILLEAKKVVKYFPDGNVTALAGVSCEVRRGEFLAIKGPSGSGKSTLLHLLGGLDTPTEGDVFFQNKRLKDALKEPLFRIKNMGFVFQSFYLWPSLNVVENILLPLVEIRLPRSEKLKRARELLSLMGLARKETAAVNNLSMGERQRVAIARALAAGPSMIFADEPTGSLDSPNATQILSLFRKINQEKNVTIVMVTHEQMADRFFDRSVSLLDGRTA